MTVTAVASVTHEEAMGFYLSNNLAPLAAPVPTKVTLAGAAATASHVSGRFPAWVFHSNGESCWVRYILSLDQLSIEWHQY